MCSLPPVYRGGFITIRHLMRSEKMQQLHFRSTMPFAKKKTEIAL